MRPEFSPSNISNSLPGRINLNKNGALILSAPRVPRNQPQGSYCVAGWFKIFCVGSVFSGSDQLCGLVLSQTLFGFKVCGFDSALAFKKSVVVG